MAEILEKTQGASLQVGGHAENVALKCASKDDKGNVSAKNAANGEENAAEENAATSARIKRMRGWLGVKSTSSLGGYDDDGGGVAYGDGHSGWNR